VAIRAKVAEVISDTELAIDAGTRAGVAIDDVVTLLKTIVVKDTGTGEELGVVRRPALRLRVVEVQDWLCVAKSIDYWGPNESEPLAFLFNRRLKTISGSRSEGSSQTIYAERGMEVEIAADAVATGQAEAVVHREDDEGDKAPA
jgi:hypothetical protein